MIIYLVRHPETEALKNRIVYGVIDSPLSETGKSTIAWAAEKLKNEDFQAMYCSPQERARLLAEGIAAKHEGLEIQIDDRIHEMDCGIFEGVGFNECFDIDKEAAQQFFESFGEYRAPGAENFDDVKARTKPFLDELIEKYDKPGKEGYNERPIIVVSHAMVMRSMISNLIGWPLREIWHLHIAPTSILKFEIKQGFARLISFDSPESDIPY